MTRWQQFWLAYCHYRNAEISCLLALQGAFWHIRNVPLANVTARLKRQSEDA